MEKNRIWITIMAILVIGTGITFYTRSITAKEQTETTAAKLMLETKQEEIETPDRSEAGISAAAVQMFEESGEAVPEESAAANEEPIPAPAMMENVKSPKEAEPVISPLDEGTTEGSTDSGGKEAYRQRLQELDSQVETMRLQDKEGTTYSMQNVAAAELKLWDTELNTVYKAIMEKLSKEEAEQLILEEREWLNQRDIKAAEAAKKYSGGTMESLEYTATLASVTRERVYELVETYGDLLPAEAGS